MIIKTVGKSESELLKSIHQRCFAHYWDAESFTHFFTVENTVALIAYEQLTPVAMAIHRTQGEQADILTIAVLPEYRRRGIAAQLLDLALKGAVANGAKELFLDVEEGNAAAIALYEKFGFSHLRRRRQYYRQTDGSYTDALVMKKRLPVASC